MRIRHAVLAGALNAASVAAVVAAPQAEPTKEQAAFFESKIRPILAESCYKCHSLEQGKVKGGLALDTKEALLKGGDNGPIVVPGDPDKSSLITAVRYEDADLQMPPKGEKLKDEQIAALVEWVKMGAPDPRKGGAAQTKLTGLTDQARHHWAFLPIKKPAIPVNKNQIWCKTPVDAFVLQKLEEKSMLPSPDAKKETLIRRATYDLIGLPPTVDELNAFLLDNTPAAFSKVVERLLASPHYGERWGRFWLDSARYADTIGGDRDERMMDYRYPYAWTYRDYVVKAFNADKPYDQFIIEQVAADKLPDLARDRTRLAALGFLTVGQRFNNANDVINDRIDVVTKGFLGLTVSCARCHDHMFDPIPIKDYYALHGIFASTTEPSEPPVINDPKPELLKDFETKLFGLEEANRQQFYKLADERNSMFRQNATWYLLAAIRGRGPASAEELKRRENIIAEHKLNGPLVNYLATKIRQDESLYTAWKKFAQMGDADFEALGAKLVKDIVDNKGGAYNKLVSEAFVGQTPKSVEDVAKIYAKVFASFEPKARGYIEAMSKAKSETDDLPGYDAEAREVLSTPFHIEPGGTLDNERCRELVNGWPIQLRNIRSFKFGQVNELKLTHAGAPAHAMIVKDAAEAKDSQVFIRGLAENKGDVVPRRFLEVLSGPRPQNFKDGSGRFELAKALASKLNPLTPRVVVNRVWMHHFGEGFVRTLDDLGTQSEKPSHPELIDYLSSYLLERNWSLKDLHRLIMNSRVYQLACTTNTQYETMDPENRLLWRANNRRLDFEAMRDSLLVFSGKLDRTMGGQPVNLTDEPYSNRRSIYGYIDRGNLPELMAHFDFSMPDMPNSKRTTTIVPQQALFLMNSPMAVDVARSIVARKDVAGVTEDLTRIINIHKVLFQRQPTKSEIQLAYMFINTEAKNQPQMTDNMKKINEKLAKQADENDDIMTRRDDGYRAIQNDGQFVERRPLTAWETYVHALLFSNEAAYVN